jgi:hypothetical protein
LSRCAGKLARRVLRGERSRKAPDLPDNDLFAWFESTESKSRINFLSLLRAEHQDYVVNAGALEYMERQGLPPAKVALLEARGGTFANDKAWTKHLTALGLRGKRHVAMATEGALMGSLLAHGFPAEMSIVSDDAGQFNVFRLTFRTQDRSRSLIFRSQ